MVNTTGEALGKDTTDAPIGNMDEIALPTPHNPLDQEELEKTTEVAGPGTDVRRQMSNKKRAITRTINDLNGYLHGTKMRSRTLLRMKVTEV